MTNLNWQMHHDNNFYKPAKTKKGLLKKLFVFGSGSIVVVIIGLILFIKLDTQAAANFTDDVLRPVLGDAQVVFLEKIFFNSSDKINQLTSTLKPPKSPFLANGSIPISANDKRGRISGLSFTLVSSTSSTLLDGEGQWHVIPLSLFPNQIVLADTFIRPDPSRSYAFVTLVKMDMSKLQLWSVAGTVEPASKVGKPGPGVVPKSIQDQGTLVAAFDGGFQYRDGQYGMIVGNTTYLPLQNDLATLVGHNDGRLEIVKYEGQDLGSDVAFVRQNCPMLIENGVIGTQDDANRKLWGRTITADIYTWRSGIGITANGNLIFGSVIHWCRRRWQLR